MQTMAWKRSSGNSVSFSMAAWSLGRGSAMVRSPGVRAVEARLAEAWIRVACEMEDSVSATRARPGRAG